MNKLNFGCGNEIKKNWDNVDIQKGKGVISFDFNKFPYPIKDNTYNYIEAKQVLNFLDRPDEVLYELRRVSKKNAIIWIKVPYWNNKGAYNDIQTIHWFNEYSFINFVEQIPCRIDREKKFKLMRLEKIPSKVGKFIPEWFRERLDLFISGLISEMKIELKVLK